jgi:hypothetical protein
MMTYATATSMTASIVVIAAPRRPAGPPVLPAIAGGPDRPGPERPLDQAKEQEPTAADPQGQAVGAHTSVWRVLQQRNQHRQKRAATQ